MGECRNCGAGQLRDLGPIGEVAPFFLKRLLGIEIGWQQSPAGVKRLVRAAAARAHNLLARVAAPRACIEMQICASCSFVQTTTPFDEAAVTRHYADYRSDAYNRERIRFEPGYAAIAPNLDANPREIESRVSAMMAFLKDRIQPCGDFTILDFGGADGKYLARYDAKKFVYEISATEPVAGVARIRSEHQLATYSLVQLAHVIEHVVNPRNFIATVASRVAPGGFLYLEAPQDLSGEVFQQLRTGVGSPRLVIHEHINQYCATSVAKLIEIAGLHLIAVETTPVDMGWTREVHVRGLGRKA